MYVRIFLYTNHNKSSTVVLRNTKARSCNHCCSGKAVIITHSECVTVALGLQHAMGMRHIVICGPVLFYNIFPYYLLSGKILEKKIIEHKMCVLIFCLPETFLILRRNEGDMIKNVYWSLCEVPFILVRF